MSEYLNNKNKTISSTEQIMLMQSYSNTAGFQMKITKHAYTDGTVGSWYCMVEMAEGKKEPGSKGTKCDWSNKVFISLSEDELSKLAKYRNPIFAKRLGTNIPELDEYGNPRISEGRQVSKTGKDGKALTYGECFYHDNSGKVSIFRIGKNKLDPLGCAVTVTKDKVSRTIYLDENMFYKMAMVSEFAMLKMIEDNVVKFSKSATTTSFTPTHRNEGNSYPRSYRERMSDTPPKEVPHYDNSPIEEVPFDEDFGF